MSSGSETPQNFDNSGQGGGLMVLGPSPMPANSMAWYGPPAPPEILNPGLDPLWLLHSLRRRWILAFGFGLLAGAMMAALAWLFIPAKASATAYLKVASVKPSVVFKVDEGGESDFETYRRTLVGQFTTQPVLQAALREPGVADLPLIRHENDQVNWLRSNLQVRFPDNSEIMRVSMEGENTPDLASLVNATTKAFMAEVIFVDRQERLRIRDVLERSYRKTMTEIEEKSRAYNLLARESYTAESQEANVDRSLAFQELSLLRQERDRLSGELLQEHMKTTLLKARQDDPLLRGAAVERLIEQDPQVMALRHQLNEAELLLTQQRSLSKRPDSPAVARFDQERRAIAARLAEREAQLRPRLAFELAHTPDADFKADLKASEIRREFLQERLVQIGSDYDNMTAQIKRWGERSLELDARRVELEQLRRVANSMGNKIESWDIELSADLERIKQIQPAELSIGLNKLQRSILVTMIGLMGFGLAGFGVALWEFQGRRLNGPAQIDEGLGLRVIGQLPPLSGRSLESAPEGTVAMLIEAIDSVRTSLVHCNHSKPANVVMVTSGGDKEGKTTVASQLAASLARAGRRTLLVDGDMRRPSLHLLFDLPLQDGLCELLRGEAKVADVLRATDASGLWLITAGHCNLDSVHALARDGAENILNELRDQFDYVVIDSAPVLSVADPLILGQHADGVILSVLRDVSPVPEIHETSQRLQDVGIRVVGVVVNGVHKPVHQRAAQVRLTAAEAEATT